MPQLWKSICAALIVWALVSTFGQTDNPTVAEPKRSAADVEPATPDYVVCFERDEIFEVVGGCPGLEFSNQQQLRTAAFDGVPFYAETMHGAEKVIGRGTVTRLEGKDEETFRIELSFFTAKLAKDFSRFQWSRRSSTTVDLNLGERFWFGRGVTESNRTGSPAIYRERLNAYVWIEKYDEEKLNQRSKPPPRVLKPKGVPAVTFVAE